jgi:hypothetical protein
LLTKDARCGCDGICYLCPSSAYLRGGDVDTILRRPELLAPSAEEVFDYLTGLSGMRSKLSDKGFFAQEFVRKVGGLQSSAAFLLDPTRASILEEYLRPEKDPAAQGCFLRPDRRRYLDLHGIANLVGPDQSTNLIDVLVEKEILHRGLILKCQHCRTADWFALEDVGEGFRCSRCRISQQILSRNFFDRSEPTWYYRLDELTYQGLRNNMHVPLLALEQLRVKSRSFMYADEQEVSRSGESKPFIEIDVCCIADGLLTIGEAKTSDRLDGGGKNERNVLFKYRELGQILGANRFLLATTGTWAPKTLESAKEIFRATNIEILTLSGPELKISGRA